MNKQPGTPPAAGAVDARVVLFDFDGVLLHGDAFTLFMQARYRRAWWRALPALPLLPILLPMLPVRAGRHAVMRMFVRLALFGVGERRYHELAEPFGHTLARDSRRFSRMGISALRSHAVAGDRVVIVTGCEECLAHAVLDELGLGSIEVIGSRLESGLFGMRIAVHNVGSEKVRQLARCGIQPPWGMMVSDSLTDLPLLAEARQAVLVNPDRHTLERAMTRLSERLRIVQWD